MPVKVGIPRALLYYSYFPMWKAFFEGLGAEVVVSGKTTKRILDNGVKEAVDEICLPVKVFYGHVIELCDQVDYIFVPRLVSVEKKAFICPKFLGLPDMIRHNIKNLPKLIDITVNLSKKSANIYKAIYEAGKIFTSNPAKIWLAYKKGMKQLNNFITLTEAGYMPDEAIEEMARGLVAQNYAPPAAGDLKIALIGHGYNIYDRYVSMNLIAKLINLGVQVLTADNIPHDEVEDKASLLPKRLFWTMGRKMVGASFHFMQREDIDGIIHVAAFGCGPDSFTGELIERKIKRNKSKPFLNLTIDEHTGEAGIVTRLEAFVDMIRWRKSNESNLSAHG